MTRWENLFRETNCKQHETPLRSANKLFAKFIRKLPDSEVIKCSEKEQNKKPWLFWRYAVCLESIYWSDSFGWLEFCGTSRALRWNDFPLSRSSIYAMQKSLKIRIKFHLISLSTYIRSLSFQRDIKKNYPAKKMQLHSPIAGEIFTIHDFFFELFFAFEFCEKKTSRWVLILHYEFITRRRFDKPLILIDFMLETRRKREENFHRGSFSVTSYFKPCNNRLTFTI